MPVPPLSQLAVERFETAPILKQLAAASRQLAELKGVAASIPNQRILVSTLSLQEAKDSSEIENIVTTHDQLFRDAASPKSMGSPAAKEVLLYRQALDAGLHYVRETGLLSTNRIIAIQAVSLGVGGEGLARRATRQDRQFGVAEQHFEFVGRDIANVTLKESGLPVVFFVGEVASGIKINARDDRKPLQNKAMRQPTCTAE